MNPGEQRPVGRRVEAQDGRPVNRQDGELSALADGGLPDVHLLPPRPRSTRVRAQSLLRIRHQLSERDWAIVGALEGFRFLGARQIQTLFFDGEHASDAAAARSCWRSLARLSSLRVIDRLERQVGGLHGGSTGFVYCLGPVGRRLLGHSPRRGQREPRTTFLDHSLSVAQVFVDLVGASKQDQLQIVRYQTEPACWRDLPGYGTHDVLRPDLFVAVAQGDYEHHWFVEVDRGTEGRTALRRKCQAYLRYYRSGAETDLFPKIAWLTTTPARAREIAEVVRSMNAEVELFEVGLLDQAVSVLAREVTS